MWHYALLLYDLYFKEAKEWWFGSQKIIILRFLTILKIIIISVFLKAYSLHMKILYIETAFLIFDFNNTGKKDEPVPFYINIPVSLALFVEVDNLGTTLCFMRSWCCVEISVGRCQGHSCDTGYKVTCGHLQQHSELLFWREPIHVKPLALMRWITVDLVVADCQCCADRTIKCKWMYPWAGRWQANQTV